VFDRIFGTFAKAPPGEPLRYGLKGRLPSNNPLEIAFGEWRQLLRDFRAAPNFAARTKVLIGAP